MRTIYLLGHSEGSALEKQLEGAGFIVLPARNADDVMGMLSAVRADAFVIDVGDSTLGGERPIDQLRRSDAWRLVPIIVTGTRPVQYRRVARRAFVGKIIPSRQCGGNAVLAAVCRATAHPTASRLEDVQCGTGRRNRPHAESTELRLVEFPAARPHSATSHGAIDRDARGLRLRDGERAVSA